MFAAAEFAPEIFGVSSDRLFAISGALVTPALGFLFLYVLRLPLASLPGIETPSDWKPPRWVLPVFALISTAAVVFTAATGLTLEVAPARPPLDEVNGHFALLRDVPTADFKAVRSIVVSVDDYDGASDFRVISNGYVQFSTSTNCLMNYQCKASDAALSPEAISMLNGPPLKYPSLFRVKQFFRLPVRLDVTNFAAPGSNFIDIIVGNSGIGDCRLAISVSLSDGGAVKRTFTLSISDGVGGGVSLRADAAAMETFFSVSKPQASALAPAVHPIYRTFEADPSFRLCQRIRLIIPLSADQLAWRSGEEWTRWAQDRRRREDCQVRNGTERDCGN